MKSQLPIDDILTLSQKLIAIPSTAEIIAPLNNIVQLAIAPLGEQFTIEHFDAAGKPSLLIHNAVEGTKHFKILLNAHLDVVPGKEAQYIPQIKDGKLYGRGAFDMKAAAAVMIYVFRDIAKTLPYPIGLQLVTDEELANGQGTLAQIEKGIRTDMAIIGECGSNFDIIHENKGLIHAYITAKGTASHGAYPWKGENAIIKMHQALTNIQKQFPSPASETAASTITVTQIFTPNDTWNLVPDSCTATLDIRTHRDDKKTMLTKVKNLLPAGVTLQVEKQRNAHYTDPEHDYIQSLQKVTESVIGRTIKVRRTFGGSDSVFFSEVGCNAIEFGPTGAGQHNDEEWVDIKSLEDYYEILRKFLVELK